MSKFYYAASQKAEAINKCLWLIYIQGPAKFCAHPYESVRMGRGGMILA
jgi:hypothetical protein